MRTMRQRAYTLIELLAAISIIAILAAILFPLIRGVMGETNQTKCGANMRNIGVLLMAYAVDNGKTVVALSTNEDGQDWRPWGQILTEYDGSYAGLRNKGEESGSFGIWLCPENHEQEYAPMGPDSREGQRGTSYSINGWSKPGDYMFNIANRYTNNVPMTFADPARLIMVYEGTYSRGNLVDGGTGSIPDLYPGEGLVSVRYAHDGGLNIVYADGHLEFHEGPLEARGRHLGGINTKAASFSNGASWFAN